MMRGVKVLQYVSPMDEPLRDIVGHFLSLIRQLS